MGTDVCFMILISESLDGLHVNYVHVFADRVFRHNLRADRNNLVYVLDTQSFQHLLVKLGQVIHLWGLLGELERSLILHNPLRHCRSVGVRNRNYINAVIKVRLTIGVSIDFVVIDGGKEVFDNTR